LFKHFCPSYPKSIWSDFFSPQEKKQEFFTEITASTAQQTQLYDNGSEHAVDYTREMLWNNKIKGQKSDCSNLIFIFQCYCDIHNGQTEVFIPSV